VTPPSNPAAELGARIADFAENSRQFLRDGLAEEIPVLGGSLGGALNGIRDRDAERIERPQQEDTDTSLGLVRRLIETGLGGFALRDIGVTVTTLPELQARLDALDDTPGNVTLAVENGVTRFDVHVNKTLTGQG